MAIFFLMTFDVAGGLHNNRIIHGHLLSIRRSKSFSGHQVSDFNGLFIAIGNYTIYERPYTFKLYIFFIRT